MKSQTTNRIQVQMRGLVRNEKPRYKQIYDLPSGGEKLPLQLKHVNKRGEKEPGCKGGGASVYFCVSVCVCASVCACVPVCAAVCIFVCACISLSVCMYVSVYK